MNLHILPKYAQKQSYAIIASPVLRRVDPDALDRPVATLRVDAHDKENELPIHTHRKKQLVLALRGGVTCEVANGLGMVPPRCGVWIPGGMPHSIATRVAMSNNGISFQ